MTERTSVMSARMSMRMLMVAVVLLVGALTVSLGMVAATPEAAHASGKTKVWVVTKDQLKEGGYTETIAFAYNKNGLLKNSKHTFDESVSTRNVYKYDSKGRLKSSINVWGSGPSDRDTTTYKRNSKGYVTKSIEKIGSQSYVMTFSYNSKGKLTKLNTPEGYAKYGYNKKGRLTSKSLEWATDKLKYDKKGRIKAVIRIGDDSTKEKATYTSGRVSKITVYDADGAKQSVRTFTYKKVSVPKKYAKMVKAQQAALIWDIVPLAAAHR